MSVIFDSAEVVGAATAAVVVEEIEDKGDRERGGNEKRQTEKEEGCDRPHIKHHTEGTHSEQGGRDSLFACRLCWCAYRCAEFSGATAAQLKFVRMRQWQQQQQSSDVV